MSIDTALGMRYNGSGPIAGDAILPLLPVMQVEDTRRVTQAALVIVDDLCLLICFEIH